VLRGPAMLSGMCRPHARWACLLALANLIVGAPRASQAVDCSTKFPVGRFALRRAEATRVAGMLPGFSPIYIRKKPLEIERTGPDDPCELVYGVDVFEFTDAHHPDALVAGCRGDFDGDGKQDFVVLLRRLDGVKFGYAFLARGATFEVRELGKYGEPPAWAGPFCVRRPPAGIFEAPDFEGTGQPARVRVVGDLVSMGWFTYYWRPDIMGFDAIITTD
jgi:hypothetical protein